MNARANGLGSNDKVVQNLILRTAHSRILFFCKNYIIIFARRLFYEIPSRGWTKPSIRNKNKSWIERQQKRTKRFCSLIKNSHFIDDNNSWLLCIL